jgi:hypothetical protein
MKDIKNCKKMTSINGKEKVRTDFEEAHTITIGDIERVVEQICPPAIFHITNTAHQNIFFVFY